MNAEMLHTLLLALQHSPDNAILRRQVVEGLVEAARWQEVLREAPPLQASDYRAYALFAQARAEYALGNPEQARTLYADATALDASLEDEGFEAELLPDEALALPVDGFMLDEPGEIHAYAGPRVTFADIGGMQELKEQIRLNILYPFQRPEIFAAYGKKVGGGILMFGPPGCGKTHIARATAGELGANFYALELNDVLSMWMGESEKHLNQLFDTARANAPSVIFIDEVDALGAKRGEMQSSPLRMAVTQLLMEMDGMQARNADVLVLGATNEPWSIDVAFRRPGRFDRILFVTPPDASAREEILRLHARDRKMAANIDWGQLAAKTNLFSGADLAGLVDSACESALTEALRHGNLRDVSQQDLLAALRTARPSTTEWLRRAKNYVTYANQDGYYDQLAHYLEKNKFK